MRATKEQVQSHRYIPVLKPTELLNITFHYHAFFVSSYTHQLIEMIQKLPTHQSIVHCLVQLNTIRVWLYFNLQATYLTYVQPLFTYILPISTPKRMLYSISQSIFYQSNIQYVHLSYALFFKPHKSYLHFPAPNLHTHPHEAAASAQLSCSYGR